MAFHALHSLVCVEMERRSLCVAHSRGVLWSQTVMKGAFDRFEQLWFDGYFLWKLHHVQSETELHLCKRK